MFLSRCLTGESQESQVESRERESKMILVLDLAPRWGWLDLLNSVDIDRWLSDNLTHWLHGSQTPWLQLYYKYVIAADWYLCTGLFTIKSRITFILIPLVEWFRSNVASVFVITTCLYCKSFVQTRICVQSSENRSRWWCMKERNTRTDGKWWWSSSGREWLNQAILYIQQKSPTTHPLPTHSIVNLTNLLRA